VRQAARLMLERRVSALPVVDEKDRVVGIVSEGDLIRRTELGTDAPRSWWLGLFAEKAARDYLKAHGLRVRDVMSHPVVSVRRTTPLAKVANVLEQHRIKRVPVLEGGRLVGIVSRADLVRRLATAPGASRPTARTSKDRALRREVLKAIEHSGPGSRYVNATVEHGVVHLWGSLPSHGQQKTLRVALRALNGVQKLEDHTSVMPLAAAAGVGLV
jgi:CBS domain-containing protein